jgi:hypothetical protein
MFKSDRPSIIMLAVNAGIPLVSLIAAVALTFRHMILTKRAKLPIKKRPDARRLPDDTRRA